MRVTNVPPLDSAEFAGLRGQLARAFIVHKADLGLAAAGASDQAIVDRVDDIMAVMLGAVARATATGDEDWLSRYTWFVDLVERLAEGREGKPLDG
jgi:hypothetical protein